MSRGGIVVARASVGWSSSFSDDGAYEFETSTFPTTVDTRHVSSLDDLDFLDPFNKIGSDPLWPYKRGSALWLLLEKFSKPRGDSASLWSCLFPFVGFP